MTVSNNLPFVSRLRNLWHAPALDRPAQFAAIRTDSEFNVIGEPEVFTASPRMTIYPSPSSINYRYYPAGSSGERRKRSRICRPYSLAFTVPKTCILATTMCVSTTKSHATFFYRNFYDPYARAGSMITRAGIYWMLCACYALRPEGINWPENDDGLPSFRLSI